jgi:hypothetical protein
MESVIRLAQVKGGRMKARALLVFLALLCASMQYSHVAARTIPRAAQKPLIERFGRIIDGRIMRYLKSSHSQK